MPVVATGREISGFLETQGGTKYALKVLASTSLASRQDLRGGSEVNAGAFSDEIDGVDSRDVDHLSFFIDGGLEADFDLDISGSLQAILSQDGPKIDGGLQGRCGADIDPLSVGEVSGDICRPDSPLELGCAGDIGFKAQGLPFRIFMAIGGAAGEGAPPDADLLGGVSELGPGHIGVGIGVLETCEGLDVSGVMEVRAHLKDMGVVMVEVDAPEAVVEVDGDAAKALTRSARDDGMLGRIITVDAGDSTIHGGGVDPSVAGGGDSVCGG